MNIKRFWIIEEYTQSGRFALIGNHWGNVWVHKPLLTGLYLRWGFTGQSKTWTK